MKYEKPRIVDLTYGWPNEAVEEVAMAYYSAGYPLRPVKVFGESE